MGLYLRRVRVVLGFWGFGVWDSGLSNWPGSVTPSVYTLKVQVCRLYGSE